MDELRGPNIQIVLHVKEGLGFGFLASPFLVSGSLNGYVLETDPAVPCHAPNFDSELVWEADKRRFRNLRIQNVPMKIEVYTTATQGRKNKVGYLLLSLLGAQPCPSNKIANIKHTWHKLLGVQAEGKCCHPQLLLSLTIEDWINTPTPRNDCHVFHSNEAATYLPAVGNITARPLSVTLEDYLAESKRTVTSTELTPQLLTEEGLIQIGKSATKKLFILSFMLGAAENIDTLLPETLDDAAECSVSYSVFKHTIQTDRFPATAGGVRKTAVQFNQRTSLRLCTDLASLSRYFAECPHVVTSLRCGDKDIGICSTDLRKLVPTEDVNAFLESFCNTDKAITIGERCFMMTCLERTVADTSRKPFIDIEISLKYVGKYKGNIPLKPNRRAARRASHLGCKSSNSEQEGEKVTTLEKRKSTSCTDVDNDAASVTYNKNEMQNTIRYISSNSTAKNQNEIADMIRKMYESFTISQERFLNLRIQPVTSDVDAQQNDSPTKNTSLNEPLHSQRKEEFSENCQESPSKDNNPSNFIKLTHEKDVLPNPTSLPIQEREYLMKKCVEELEDWKEKQQDLFKFQMKQKEDYHLQMLSEEWNKRQTELENRLSRGIEQCRSLATDLSRATEDFRLRIYTVAQRERKAKQTLEQNYTSKFRELREASKKMEDDMKHRTKLKDMRIEELETEMEQLHKENDTIKTNLRDVENEAQTTKSGLTKGQTSDLIQELRNVEEKLDEAVQSKAFFKEQWGRAVRELHSAKLQHRRHMLTQLQQSNRLADAGLDNIVEGDRHNLKDDFYTTLLAETPVLADAYSQSGFPSIIDDAESLRESVKMLKKPRNEKLNDLIEHRERLIQSETPDEENLTRLNNEIRNILLTCKT